MFLDAAVVLLCQTALAEPPQYALETAPAQRIEAVLTYDVRAPQLSAREWIVIAPSAPELPCQSDVTSRLEPAGLAVRELSSLKRPILRGQRLSPGGKGDLEIKATYQATLWRRRLLEAEDATPIESPPNLKEAFRQSFLAATPMYDLANKKFRAWLQENDLDKNFAESDIAFAKRVFLTLKRDFQYSVREDDPRSASAVCENGRSDCGGLSVLFVSALRANGIPARSLVGRWAASSKAGATIDGAPFVQQHVKAEFFATGIGWVPVDVSSAILYDRQPEGQRYFGHDPGDFLVLHIDPELVVDSLRFGKKPVLWLQGPVFWAIGEGAFDDHTTSETWEVKKLGD